MFLNRIGYLARKAWRARSDGILWEKSRRYLARKLTVPAAVALEFLKLSAVDRKLNLAAGFADHRGRNDHISPDPLHLRRIIAAYKASKSAETNAAAPFEIHGLWSEWIDVNFQELIRALQREDVDALAALFNNFHRERFTVGLGATYDDWVAYNTSLTGCIYLRVVWSSYRDKLLSQGCDLSAIRSPLIGNPAGIHCNGDVIQINTFRKIHHALEMREWMRNHPGGVIAEIGGGVGTQAYHTKILAGPFVSKYVIFDIPEVAAIASYFLLSALPKAKIRLFGEGAVSTDLSEDFDLAIFPHFSAADLKDHSIDLFHNSCSFSEMDGASSSEYLNIIERACRGLFSHINHEVKLEFRNFDGSTSANIIGSELVPNPDRFKRVFKKPRLFSLPEDRGFPAFEYLYERVREEG